MAAVHFTTIPCEPNTAYKTQGKPNFYNSCLCTKDIVYRRFGDFTSFHALRTVGKCTSRHLFLRRFVKVDILSFVVTGYSELGISARFV